MWIVGGGFTTSWIYDGSTITDCPIVPFAVNMNCLLHPPSDATLLVSGKNGNTPTNNFYSYNWTMDEWTKLPDLPTARNLAGCALYKWQGDLKVMVAGGRDASNTFRTTVEIFSFATKYIS